MLPNASIADPRLSRNFRLSEFLRSETAEKLGLDNSPNEEELANITETARHLQSLRDWLPGVFGETIYIEITSGFRNEAVNDAVGGSETSDHRNGLAADIRFRRKSGAYLDPARVARAIVDNPYRRFDQIILYPGQRRLHIGFGGGWQMRRQILHKTADGYAFGFPAS